MRDRRREEGKWRKRGWKWAVMLSGHSCNSPVVCPDWTGLGPACTGNVCEFRPNPWELQDTWTLPLLPLCPPTGTNAIPSTPSREGKEGSVRPGSPPLGCRRAHSPHPSKTPEPKGADLVPVLNNGWQEQL